LNKSIKENILFGSEYDEARYNETIKICQLRRDLEILPGGDLTEIGEKGINLSGGQKARVGLARAVYADRDLILMDDPISALDANVKKKIFKSVFMKKFAKKTRILVTHAIDFLHLVDQVILIKEGRVVLHGPYQEVKENVYLKELVRIFKSHQRQADNADEPLIDLSSPSI
jgi:ATP-binding cassette subfamily C (CFTR/MRP) protein 1